MDSFASQAAMAELKAKKPRLMFIGFGETDEWAHGGSYDHYLHSAQNVDRFCGAALDHFAVDSSVS